MRATLGAGRARIVRQLLVESLLLSFVAGALGLVAGLWGVRGLLALAPHALPRVDEIGFDWRVALFTGGVSLLTGLIFGTISALPGTRAGLLGSLGRGGSRGATGAGAKVREVLIAAETAIAVVLLAGSGLLIASFARLRSVDPGFDVTNLMTARFGRMPAAYNEEGRQWEFEKRLLDELRAIPGIEGAAALANFPLQRGVNLPIAIEGRPDDFEGAIGVARGFGRVLQDISNSGRVRSRLLGRRQAGHSARRDHQCGDREAILARREPDRKAN